MLLTAMIRTGKREYSLSNYSTPLSGQITGSPTTSHGNDTILQSHIFTRVIMGRSSGISHLKKSMKKDDMMGTIALKDFVFL